MPGVQSGHKKKPGRGVASAGQGGQQTVSPQEGAQALAAMVAKGTPVVFLEAGTDATASVAEEKSSNAGSRRRSSERPSR
jgi:hypothetical protein